MSPTSNLGTACYNMAVCRRASSPAAIFRCFNSILALQNKQIKPSTVFDHRSPIFISLAIALTAVVNSTVLRFHMIFLECRCGGLCFAEFLQSPLGHSFSLCLSFLVAFQLSCIFSQATTTATLLFPLHVTLRHNEGFILSSLTCSSQQCRLCQARIFRRRYQLLCRRMAGSQQSVSWQSYPRVHAQIALRSSRNAYRIHRERS